MDYSNEDEKNILKSILKNVRENVENILVHAGSKLGKINDVTLTAPQIRNIRTHLSKIDVIDLPLAFNILSNNSDISFFTIKMDIIVDRIKNEYIPKYSEEDRDLAEELRKEILKYEISKINLEKENRELLRKTSEIAHLELLREVIEAENVEEAKKEKKAKKKKKKEKVEEVVPKVEEVVPKVEEVVPKVTEVVPKVIEVVPKVTEDEKGSLINSYGFIDRTNHIFDKKIIPIKKIYDETNNTCNKVMKDINSIQDDILEKKMDIKTYSDNIKSSLNNEIKIKDIDFNTYNNIIEKISNLNMDIKNKNNVLLDIKNDLANYYFYFDPFEEENKRNKIEDCKTQKNRCARLQLAIDIDEPDLYKKIKIHGIFPDEKQGISNKKYENPFLLSEEYDIKSFNRILNENFIPFFSSYHLFEKSLNKHLPYSNQTELYFENNIIWLSEAIIVLLTKHRNGKILLEPDIYLMETMLNKFFKNEHNLIWGFQKSIINPINRNILYIYFKICFNTTSNLWQFCDNNYDIIDDEEVYLTNLDTGLGHKKQKSKRKRSVRKKSKRKSIRQKSKRKSIRQKSKRKRSLRQKSKRKSVR